MYQVDKEYQAPILPPVPQPKGLNFFLRTWSGYIIILNTIFFVLLSLDAGSFFSPDGMYLSKWGAKDNFLIVNGEFWRLITPVFLHVGFVHFAFNNYALFVLSYQIEHHLGKRWFLVLYLISGLAGNVASSIFSLGLSAGASSSLFGLLGAGFYLEKVVGKQLNQVLGKARRPSLYTGMVIANIVLGFMIPQIDNSAHFGGLIAGIILTYSLLRIQANQLLPLNPRHGLSILLVMALVLLAGGILASSKDFLIKRYHLAMDNMQDPRIQYAYLSKILGLTPKDDEVRLLRLELSLKYGNYSTAKLDFEQLTLNPQNDAKIKRVEKKLFEGGYREAVSILQEFWRRSR